MALSKNIATYFNGEWQMGNRPIIAAGDQAAWLGSQVFDGARKFEGVMPDLDLHSARIIRSAQAMGMRPTQTGEEVQAIIEEGVKLFPDNAELYLRPMMWAMENGGGIIDFDPESVGFAVCIEELPMPKPSGFTLTTSPYRRPPANAAITEAKSAALYANNSRIVMDARARGFSNAISLDQEGRVAETSSTNIFMVRGGVVYTPAPTGLFLNGITRQRVIGLLRQDGVEVVETNLNLNDFAQADEMFVTGNIAKVMPVDRYEEKSLTNDKLTKRARELYWDYALSVFA